MAENYTASPPSGQSAEDVRIQQFWGIRYIDDAIMYRSKARIQSPVRDSDLTFVAAAYDAYYYQITDAQFSVVEVLSDSGVKPPILERTRYTPYGEARQSGMGDFNRDGALNPDDLGDFINCFFLEVSTPGICPRADFNRDRAVDPDDLADFITVFFLEVNASYGPTEPGAVSRIGNVIGYCGYIFNQGTVGMLTSTNSVGGIYAVRFRNYACGIGRFLEKDPAWSHTVPRVHSQNGAMMREVGQLAIDNAYDNGLNLWEYVFSSPAMHVDPLGLDGDNLWPSWIPRDATVEEIEKMMQDLLAQGKKEMAKQCTTAKKLVEQRARIKQKSPNMRGGRRGFVTRGTALALVVGAAILLNEAADFLNPQTGNLKCRQFFDELKRVVETGECTSALERYGKDCEEEILEHLGDKNWAGFVKFRESIRSACQDAKKKADEDAEKKKDCKPCETSKKEGKKQEEKKK